MREPNCAARFDRIDVEWFVRALQRKDLLNGTLAARRADLLQEDSGRGDSSAIREFLATGRDGATGEPFAIRSGGGDWLPLRPFVSWLLRSRGARSIRLAGPAKPRRSRESSHLERVPEEWACCAAQCRMGGTSTSPYLAAKISGMVSYEPWHTTTNRWVLEAFDIAVFSRDPAADSRVAEMLQARSPHFPGRRVSRSIVRGERRAASDELSQNAPAALLGAIDVACGLFRESRPRNIRRNVPLWKHLPGARRCFCPGKTKLIKALSAPGSFVSDNLLTAARDPAEDATRSADWSARIMNG